MAGIKTLVYFDIEATGLKSSGRPRITEVSFVAVNNQGILDLHRKIQNHVETEKDNMLLESLLPRVINKLTLCIYPMATIMPDVTDITGLDNYNLTGQAKFDKNTAQLIKAFLSRLPAPICLIAHNGNLYDFPLLRAEIDKVEEQLGFDILCADSYVGMKVLLRKMEEKSRKENASKSRIYWLKKGELIKTEVTTTGNKQTTTQSPKTMEIDKPSSSKVLRLRQRSESSLMSFSLINLHVHLFGCTPARSHGAEADCLALMRITARLGQEWLDWVENNSSLFRDCLEMWGRF